MESILWKFLGRFLTMSAVEEASYIIDLEFMNEDSQLRYRKIMVGFTTRQVLVCLQKKVEPNKISKFYSRSVLSSLELPFTS